VALLAVGHFVGIRLMADWRVMESLLAPGGETDLAPLGLALAFVAVRMAALFLGPGLAILAVARAAGGRRKNTSRKGLPLMRHALAVLVAGHLGLFMAPAAVAAPAPAEPLADAATPYRFLILDRDTPGHDVTILVNDAAFAIFKDGAGDLHPRPVPFVEGRNRIAIEMARRKDAPDGEPEESVVALYLGASPEVEAAAPVFEVSSAGAAVRVEMDVDWAGGRPGRLSVVERHWADAARTRLVYQFTAAGPALADAYDETHEQEWFDSGRPRSDLRTQGEKVVASRQYKPDGTPGAEVVDGNGWCRHWSDEGVLAGETPYRDGLPHGLGRTFHASGRLESECTYVHGKLEGPRRQFHEDGRLQAEGLYQDDRREGVWTLCGAKGTVLVRLTFSEGEPVLPPARDIADGRLGVSLRVPEGFEEYPGGRAAPNVLHAFISLDLDAPQDCLALAIAKVPGAARPEPPSQAECRALAAGGVPAATLWQIQELTGGTVTLGAPQVGVFTEAWQGLPLSGLAVRVAAGERVWITRSLMVPVPDGTLVLTAAAPEWREEEAADLVREVLATVEGPVGYPPLARLFTRAEAAIVLVTGLVLAAGVLTAIVVLVVLSVQAQRPPAARP
jgi:hypothetical protein